MPATWDGRSKATHRAMLYAERNRDKAGTTKLLMALYHTLGLLYLEQGYDTEAEDAFSKAVAAAQETGSAELEGYSRYMLSVGTVCQRPLCRGHRNTLPAWSGHATRWHSVSSPSRSPCKT